MWTCSKCGLPNANPTACNRCQSPPPAPVEGLRRASEPLTLLEWFRLLRWGGGGIFIILVGIWLLTSPTFRQDPKVFTPADAMPGVGALIVGLVMVGMVVLSLFGRRS